MNVEHHDIPPRIRVLVTEPGSMRVRVMTITDRLEQLQELVGGDIEHVTLTSDRVGAYIHGEGRLENQAQNEVASMIYWHCRGLAPSDVWDIRGKAVLCGGPDGAGWDTDIPQTFVDTLAAVPGVEIVAEA